MRVLYVVYTLEYSYLSCFSYSLHIMSYELFETRWVILYSLLIRVYWCIILFCRRSKLCIWRNYTLHLYSILIVGVQYINCITLLCRWMRQWLTLLSPLGAATATGTHQWLEARAMIANRLVLHIKRAVRDLTPAGAHWINLLNNHLVNMHRFLLLRLTKLCFLLSIWFLQIWMREYFSKNW